MSFSNHIQAGSSVSFADTIVGVSESPQNSTFKHTPEDEERPPFASDIPSIIPLDTDDRARTLVLCFDGTGDQYVHLFPMCTSTSDKSSRFDADVSHLRRRMSLSTKICRTQT